MELLGDSLDEQLEDSELELLNNFHKKTPGRENFQVREPLKDL